MQLNKGKCQRGIRKKIYPLHHRILIRVKVRLLMCIKVGVKIKLRKISIPARNMYNNLC